MSLCSALMCSCSLFDFSAVQVLLLEAQICQFLRKLLAFSENGLHSAMRLSCHVTPVLTRKLALFRLADSCKCAVNGCHDFYSSHLLFNVLRSHTNQSFIQEIKEYHYSSGIGGKGIISHQRDSLLEYLKSL